MKAAQLGVETVVLRPDTLTASRWAATPYLTNQKKEGSE